MRTPRVSSALAAAIAAVTVSLAAPHAAAATSATSATRATSATTATSPGLSPSISPSISPVVVLTKADNGRVVRVHKGDVIEVQLPPTVDGDVMWSWTFPQASNPNVLAVLPLPTPYGTGFFTAAARGSTTLNSVETCTAITPQAVCTALGIRWTATVRVV